MATTMADLKALAGEEEQAATLKKLPRKELQALAKAHGINATQKNATLVGELVRFANKPPRSRSPFLNKDKPEDVVLIQAVDDKFVEENGCKSWEEWESEVMVEEFVNESDEDVWFTKGVAVVTPIDENGTRGPSTTIKAGDFAVIPGTKDLIWEWDIKEPVHKHYREHE